MQFTKLFNSILDSTIWQESAETKIVWITMLAMCDRYGDVFASVPGLASRSGVTLSQCECAIACFLSPDKYSRTKNHEGRRIKEIDGGWNLLNHGKYRDLLSVEERREYNRRKQEEYRAKKKQSVNDMSNNVKDCQSKSTMSTHTDTDTEANTEAEKKKPTPNPADGGRGGGLDNLPTAPESIKISELFHRRPSTKWSAKEIKAYKAIPREALADLDLVCQYTEAERLKGEQGRHRRDLLTFLNNFTGELDRARAKPINGNGKTTTAAQYGI